MTRRSNHVCVCCYRDCDCPGLHMMTDCERCQDCQLHERIPMFNSIDPWFDPPPPLTRMEKIVLIVVVILTVLLISVS